MSDISCFHCTKKYPEDKNHCPYCQAPSPAQQNRELAKKKGKYILYFVGLVIFCAIMIIWLPREIH